MHALIITTGVVNVYAADLEMFKTDVDPRDQEIAERYGIPITLDYRDRGELYEKLYHHTMHSEQNRSIKLVKLNYKGNQSGSVIAIITNGSSKLYTTPRQDEKNSLLSKYLDFSCTTKNMCTAKGLQGHQKIYFLGGKPIESIETIGGSLLYSEYENSRLKNVEMYRLDKSSSNEQLPHERPKEYVSKTTQIWKYNSEEAHAICTYFTYGGNLKGQGSYSRCTPYFNYKKHGNERLYDSENNLTEERLFNNGEFVHTISKRDWGYEGNGKKILYFDTISKIEDGVCVERKVSDNSILSSKSAYSDKCLGSDDALYKTTK